MLINPILMMMDFHPYIYFLISKMILSKFAMKPKINLTMFEQN